MLEAKEKALEESRRLQRRAQEENRPQQYELPDEVWLTKDHPRARRDMERKLRAENQLREEEAKRRKTAADSYASHSRRVDNRQHRERRQDSSNEGSEGETREHGNEDDGEDDEEGESSDSLHVSLYLLLNSALMPHRKSKLSLEKTTI